MVKDIEYLNIKLVSYSVTEGRCGRDCRVVWFTTTNAISAYHNWCDFESRSWPGVQYYLIKLVSDLVSVFLRVLQFSPPIKLNDTAEILLEMALITIKQSDKQSESRKVNIFCIKFKIRTKRWYQSSRLGLCAITTTLLTHLYVGVSILIAMLVYHIKRNYTCV